MATEAAPVKTYSAEVEATFNLITKDLAEVLHPEIIKDKLALGQQVAGYWGTACTGRPHLGYFVPLTKLSDLLEANVKLTILLADLHACLDGGKSTFDIVAHRVIYYSKLLHAVLVSLGVQTETLKFVTGTSYQLKPDYTLDMYRLTSLTSERDSKKAGSEVVKQMESAPLSGSIYPLLQALDEEYLDVDLQIGGVDQRKIFTYAQEYLPKLGYRVRAHLCNQMVPGLAGGKMSSSDPNSKIDFLDDEATVKKKIKAAFCEEKNITDNGLLSFMKAVIVPVSIKRRSQFVESNPSKSADDSLSGGLVHAGAPTGTLLSISRDEKWGGPIHYDSYQALEDSFASGELFPADLKRGTTDAINNLLGPVRKAFAEDQEWQAAEANAYPKEEPVKKVKEVKKSKKTSKPAAGVVEDSKKAAEAGANVAVEDVATTLAKTDI